MAERLTVHDLRRAVKDAYDGPDALARLLRAYQPPQYAYGAVIDMLATCLRTRLNVPCVHVVELYVSDYGTPVLSLMQTRLPDDNAITNMMRVITGDTRQFGLDTRIEPVLLPVPLSAEQPGTMAYQIIVTSDALIVGARRLWERQ